jgi:hypothetical protein
MTKRFVCWHENTITGEEPGVCEIESGICYDHYATEVEAQASCDKMNAQSAAAGWGSRYWTTVAPDGLELSK